LMLLVKQCLKPESRPSCSCSGVVKFTAFKHQILLASSNSCFLICFFESCYWFLKSSVSWYLYLLEIMPSIISSTFVSIKPNCQSPSKNVLFW
jgi:hypothetical protein